MSFHKSLHSLHDLCQRLWVHITSPVKNLPALPQIQNAYFLTYSLGTNAVNSRAIEQKLCYMVCYHTGSRLQKISTLWSMVSVSCSELTGMTSSEIFSSCSASVFKSPHVVPSEMLFYIPWLKPGLCKLLLAFTYDLYVPTRHFLPEICHF